MEREERLIELLNPVFAGAYNNRAILKTNIGNLNEAMEDYNKAIELDPNNYKCMNFALLYDN